jgi:hypothetical protein
MSGLDITPAMSATNNMNSTIPSVKMIYANHSYDMLPFIVLNEEGVKKLNFPHLPDQYKPEVVMASDKNFTFQFSKTPREINAFGIDYEADTTEVTPLTKTGKINLPLEMCMEYSLLRSDQYMMTVVTSLIHAL